MNDGADAKAVFSAMQAIGFTADEEAKVFEILAIILFLGEIEVGPSGPTNVDGKLLKLLGVSADAFKKGVTNNTRVVGGQQTASPLDAASPSH